MRSRRIANNIIYYLKKREYLKICVQEEERLQNFIFDMSIWFLPKNLNQI
jgi:hypothetical protein